MSQEPDLQYCKTDLIGSKGIVFCKYTRASSALHVMEAINETGMVISPAAAQPSNFVACALFVSKMPGG